MSARPQTIQIYLPSGDPRGIRVAEITTRIVRVIEVPRSLVDAFLQMPEAQQVGLYLLIGGSEGSEAEQTYIGQSGCVGARIAQHNQSKDFWNRALAVVSLTDSLTQTHALFLEWLALKQAKAAGRYQLENGNAGARPHTPAPLEADCHEIYETARTLLATLGYPVFEPVASAASGALDELFYCKAVGADGRGMYTAEGFVVLEGSVGRLDNVPSIQGTPGEKMRQALLASGVLKPNGNRVTFVRNHLFRSPSGAAFALLGRTANGWVEWKDKGGKTLGELKRSPAPVTQDI